MSSGAPLIKMGQVVATPVAKVQRPKMRSRSMNLVRVISASWLVTARADSQRPVHD